MEEEGLDEEEILKEIRKRIGKEPDFLGFGILGSMSGIPMGIAYRLLIEHMERNVADEDLFPETSKIEREVVSMLASLLKGDEAVGHVVSGGSEANILAIWSARSLSGRHTGEVIAPESAHFSLEKACQLMGLRLVKARLGEDYTVDVEDVKERIGDETVALVGVAGSTTLGRIDDIRALSDLAIDHDLYLHVDAAFGGFVIPFLRELGHDIPEFDFGLEGVCSITIDPHKMGMAPMPSGSIIFRDRSYMVPFDIAGYEGRIISETLLGTRPGASIIATWAVMKRMGRRGYREVAKRCMGLTMKMSNGIEGIEGVDPVIKPVINILGIKAEIGPGELYRRLYERGWYLMKFPTHLRAIVLPHISEADVVEFLRDLEDVVKG